MDNSINNIYENKRRERNDKRLEIELEYNKKLLSLQEEEVDDWIDICAKANRKEGNFNLSACISNLSLAEKEMRRLLDEVKDLEERIGLIEEEL